MDAFSNITVQELLETTDTSMLTAVMQALVPKKFKYMIFGHFTGFFTN